MLTIPGTCSQTCTRTHRGLLILIFLLPNTAWSFLGQINLLNPCSIPIDHVNRSSSKDTEWLIATGKPGSSWLRLLAFPLDVSFFRLFLYCHPTFHWTVCSGLFGRAWDHLGMYSVAVFVQSLFSKSHFSLGSVGHCKEQPSYFPSWKIQWAPPPLAPSYMMLSLGPREEVPTSQSPFLQAAGCSVTQRG